MSRGDRHRRPSRTPLQSWLGWAGGAPAAATAAAWHHPSPGGTIRTIYAAQFQIEPTGGDAAALEATVGRLAEAWVSGSYPVAVGLPLGGGELVLQPGHSVILAFAPPGGGHRHWSLRWRRPSPSHAVSWEAVLTLAQAGPHAELSCVVRLASPGKPSNTALRRPGVVRAAIEELRCSAGGLPLRAGAVPLAAADVPAFVEGGLCSPERTLPVLVISRDESGNEPAIEPGVLVDRLVGVAHVLLLDDKQAAVALTDAVGKDRSCDGGALRLYLPGFSLDGDPNDHPRYLQAASGKRGRPVSLPDLILQRVAADASARFRAGSITQASGDALGVTEAVAPLEPKRRARRLLPLAAPAPAAEVAEPDQASLDWLVAENEVLTRRVSELEQQALGLDVALEEARDTIAAQKDQLAAMSLALRSRPPGAQAKAAPEPELASVPDAVALAKVRFADRLLFLASAEAAASDSPFQNARRAFEALKAVDEVAELRRASIQDRTSVGSMENLFQSRGFLYKAHESMTARGRWGEEYQVVFQGRKESIEEHVAIGTGGPESCLRIHFFWDTPSRRFVVAHVGRHKTNTKS